MFTKHSNADNIYLLIVISCVTALVLIGAYVVAETALTAISNLIQLTSRG